MKTVVLPFAVVLVLASIFFNSCRERQATASTKDNSGASLCDLTGVPEKVSESEARNSYGKKTLIANPYFAQKIWEEFCPSAVAARTISKSSLHPFLYSMDVAGIFECRMFKIATDGAVVGETSYYQCAIRSDAWDNEALLTEQSAMRLWNFWPQVPGDFNGEASKSLNAVVSMPTQHQLFYEDDTVSCFKENTKIRCILSNDVRERAL